jgi:four helix bundle protein
LAGLQKLQHLDHTARRRTGPGVAKELPLPVGMIADTLRDRTRQFALDVMRACATLGRDDFARTIRPQLLRAATGIAANYRAACRSRSAKEFIARISVVVEEADEAELWLDFTLENQLGQRDQITKLRQEATELRAIMSRSHSTARARRRRSRTPIEA